MNPHPMRNIPLEDTSLLSAIQKGDRSAFDVLFQKYYSVLCTYCYRFVRLEDAEEIVQDKTIAVGAEHRIVLLK
jgi:RNA polymerase sigma-70 factor (ECF subfamily)